MENLVPKTLKCSKGENLDLKSSREENLAIKASKKEIFQEFFLDETFIVILIKNHF